jgi:5,10-methylenetetrahydrofolate reductase
MKSLRHKILDSKQPVIFYELLPPTNNETANLDAYIDCAIDLLTSTAVVIDAVNIPDIRDEEQKSTQACPPKLDPVVLAKMLVAAAYNRLEVVLNRCTVYEPMAEQLKWLDDARLKHEITNLILVGGASSEVTYPGPSVIEIGKHIQAQLSRELLIGGITIQTRRKHAHEKDEPFRLIAKSQCGFEYFTTQVIYEPVSIKLLLRDYWTLCQEHAVAPKRIFLSFAPISAPRDLEFLRWLGVSIPKTVEQELLKADIGIGWRSAKMATSILQEILHFMDEEKIKIPLGLNIEHITRHNFELSFQFIERLGKIYRHNMGFGV